MGAVDIVATHDDDRKLEALGVRMHHHLSRSLGGGVWVGRKQQAVLEQVLGIIGNLSVDLIGRDVDELLDLAFLGTLQKHVSPVNVGVSEAIRVSETQVHVRLSCEVEDGIDIKSLHTIDDLDRVGDVAMVEAEVTLAVENSGVVQGCTVIELVE